eukprot:scaffold224040_cov31-Tisochrysis_lutea.AAC.1
MAPGRGDGHILIKIMHILASFKAIVRSRVTEEICRAPAALPNARSNPPSGKEHGDLRRQSYAGAPPNRKGRKHPQRASSITGQ